MPIRRYYHVVEAKEKVNGKRKYKHIIPNNSKLIKCFCIERNFDPGTVSSTLFTWCYCFMCTTHVSASHTGSI
jgi:hypothetical protein